MKGPIRRAVRILPSFATAAIAALLVPGTAAANNSIQGHTETFRDTLCGFTGTTTIVNTTEQVDGSMFIGRFVQTFVADNGRGVTITFDAGNFKVGPTVTNPDGTSSFVAIEDGVNGSTQALNGPLLEQSTGRIQVTVTLDANGEATSVAVVPLAGPSNNTTGEPNCAVIAPWLGG